MVILVGVHARRAARDEAGYYVADRGLGLPVASATLSATVIGGSATVVAAAYVYQVGLAGMWLDLAGAIGLLILALLFAARVRRTGAYSLPELVERLFDRRARRVAAVLVLVAEVAWVALLLGSTLVVLAALGGDGGGEWSRDLFLVGIAGAFIAYTMVGGQAAVARSDLVQLCVMLAGAVALAVFALREAGGWEALGGLGDHLSFPTSPGMGAGRVGALVLVIGLPHIVGPDIYSKLLSARDDGTARRASLVAAGVKAAFAGLVAVIALCAVLVLPEDTGAYSVLPEMITTTLPPVAAGIVIAALVAAMMSSADSCLLTAGTVAAHDIWPAFRGGPVEGREALLVARSATLVVGLLALLLAMVTTSLLDLLKLAYTVFASGLILPILLGFYRERTGVTPLAATLAFVAGGGTGLVWNVLQMTVGWGTWIDAIAPGLLACGVTMVVARFALKERPADNAPSPGA